MIQWLITGGFVNAVIPTLKNQQLRIMRVVPLVVVIVGFALLKSAIMLFNAPNVSN
jgi:hypothetical protein